MDIDQIRINFSEDQLVLLNICLAFLMFGVALDIRISDFKRIFQQPKAPIVGLLSEYFLLPVLTIILVYLFQPAYSLALGMVLIAVCPGGSTSNFMVHLAKANTALSVTLTSITTLSAIVITPLTFAFWASWIPNSTETQYIAVDTQQMFSTIIQLIFIPVAIGMAVNHYFPNFTKKIERPIRILSLLIFVSFVIFGVAGNYDNIVNYIYLVFFIVLIHNTLAFLVGYFFAKANRLSDYDARAICIETGIQNTGLGLILIFNFFDGLGGMAIMVAWWGIWHLIAGGLLAGYWSWKGDSTITN